MTDRSDSEVVEFVESLLRESQQLRNEADRYERVGSMYMLPKLPKDLARDEAVYVLSPDVIHEARETRAKIMTFDSEIEVRALRRTAANTVSRADQKAIDDMESAGAMFLRMLDPNGYQKSDTTQRQLVEPLAVSILEMHGIDSPKPEERFCWSSFNVDLAGCGWLERDGIPTSFGRHYNQYIHKTIDQYSNRRDGPKGDDARLKYEKGKWSWDREVLSDDRGKERQIFHGMTGFEKAEMLWLDDGEWIYHVALDNRETGGLTVGPVHFGRKSERKGTIVWKGPNPFGRVSAFLTPSNVTAARLLQDKYLPFFFDLIVTSEQDNVVQSIRATASRNRAAPRDYVHPDPEVAKIMAASGKSFESYEWADGRTPVLLGEIKSRPMDIDPDMAALAEELAQRKARYSGAAAVLRDPDVLKNSTLGAVLAGYDAENASLSVIVGPQDVTKRQMLEAWEHSVKWLGDPKNGNGVYKTGPQYAKFQFQAAGGEMVRNGKQLKGGETVEITPKFFDTPHQWNVRTSQRSRGQATAEFEAAVMRFVPLPNGMPNIGIIDDLMRAANISDVDERMQTRLEESMDWEMATPYIQDLVKRAIDFKIEQDSGFRPGLLPPPDPLAPPAPPNQGSGEQPNTGLTVNSPVTEPAEGTGQPEFTAG